MKNWAIQIPYEYCHLKQNCLFESQRVSRFMLYLMWVRKFGFGQNGAAPSHGVARPCLSGAFCRQVVSVAGDDDADFAFGAAHVTAGSFRLQYEEATTDCIG